MKLKELESFLSQCESFKTPKIELEQYATSAHIAARMIYSAQDDIFESAVCDLGSGCGVLAIGAVVVEAACVTGFEFDSDAIALALENADDLLDQPCPPLDFVQTKLGADDESYALEGFDDFYDVVLMNPPFGTKNNAGADYGFLKCATRLVKPGGVIYSLHKTSTRNFFQRKLSATDSSSTSTERQLGLSGKVLAEVSFDLPKSYRFHKEKCGKVAVDFWRFDKI